VTEALSLGRVFRALPNMTGVKVSTSIGRRSESLVAKPGDCASACVLLYLGGTFRSIAPESRLGVHQFSFGSSDVGSSDAASISQLLSADVVNYLAEVGVDTALFTAMSRTSPSAIDWVDHSKLREMSVITDDVLWQNSEYKNVEGIFYLLLSQQSYHGLNKLIVGCVERKLRFVAMLQSSEISDESLPLYDLNFVIDDFEFSPNDHSKFASAEKFIKSAEFTLSADEISRLSNSRRVGAKMMIPGADIFFGFAMNVPDSKLRDIISGCH
jgi:hypothetical protein